MARKVKLRRDSGGVTLPSMSPFSRRPVTIPPDSTSAWIHLAIWECWMGMLISVALGLGLFLILTSPRHIVTVSDLSGCYAPPPVTVPCERIVYRGGMADNVLKPLMLGRGVDAPMPVILLGALGGMGTAGILGMFVGATLLALGYQIFMGWVEAREDADVPVPVQEVKKAT